MPSTGSTPLRLAAAAAILTAAGCASVPPASPGAASPAESDWRKARYAAAIEGLHFQDDRVVADPLPGADAEFAQRRLAEGADLAEGGYHAKAIKAYGDAIRAQPDLVEAYLGLGMMLQVKHKTSEALAAYLTAVQIDPRHAQARFDLAILTWRLGDARSAIEQMTRVVQLDPADGAAHGQLARWHYYAKDYETARHHVREAQRLGEALPPQFLQRLAEAMPDGGGTEARGHEGTK